MRIFKWNVFIEFWIALFDWEKKIKLACIFRIYLSHFRHNTTHYILHFKLRDLHYLVADFNMQHLKGSV